MHACIPPCRINRHERLTARYCWSGHTRVVHLAAFNPSCLATGVPHCKWAGALRARTAHADTRCAADGLGPVVLPPAHRGAQRARRLQRALRDGRDRDVWRAGACQQLGQQAVRHVHPARAAGGGQDAARRVGCATRLAALVPAGADAGWRALQQGAFCCEARGRCPRECTLHALRLRLSLRLCVCPFIIADMSTAPLHDAHAALCCATVASGPSS